MSIAVKIRLLVGISVGTISIIGLSAYRAADSMNVAIQEVRRSQEVALSLESVHALLSDAETAQRGFVLTGRENYLEPLETARLSMPQVLADLDRRIVDAGQRESFRGLQPVIADRFIQINKVVTARRRNFAAAQALVLTDHGKEIMADLRRKIVAMQARQASLLEARRTVRDAHARRTRLFVILGGLISTAFLLGASQAIVREMARRESLQRELDILRQQVSDQVSHELRSPLTSTFMVLSLLADADISPTMRKHVEIARRNADHMLRMIDDLMDAARSSTGKLAIQLETRDLSALTIEIVTALQGVASMKEIILSSDLAQGLPSARVDSGRYRQMITNIVENALKFTPKGGRVTVTLTRAAEEGFLEAAVADTGPGMAQEDLQRIFDRLYQAASLGKAGLKGLGLGLYITRELVHAHGGRIWVESTPGQGSVFRFTLPIA